MKCTTSGQLKLLVLVLAVYITASLTFTQLLPSYWLSVYVGDFTRGMKLQAPFRHVNSTHDDGTPATDNGSPTGEEAQVSLGDDPHAKYQRVCKEHLDASTVTSFGIIRELMTSTTNMSSFQSCDANDTIYVYSAHFNEVEKPPVVTIVGFGNVITVIKRVICRYNSGVSKDNSTSPSSRLGTDTVGDVIVMPDHHDEKYGAIYIHCRLPKRISRPTHVSVFVDMTDQESCQLPVNMPLLREDPPCWKLAMCISPMHGPYWNWRQVAEAIEIARILGADQVVAYVKEIGVEVALVLQHYVKQGFLLLYPWFEPPEPLHYNGQIGAISDCLLRMRRVAKLVVFTDLDEVILPRMHDSWVEMLQYVRNQSGNESSNIGEFQFRNVFYYSAPFNAFLAQNATDPLTGRNVATNLTEPQLRKARKFKMQTVLNHFRGQEILLPTYRSKCIVDPLKVKMMGIHFTVSRVKGSIKVAVDPKVATLNHYRPWNEEITFFDNAADKFAPQLLENIESTVQIVTKYIADWFS